MDKRQQEILKYLEKNNSISLINFLVSYCGIYNNIKFDEITHDDVKQLFPDLKRTSYEYIINNIKDIYTGKVILAKDHLGHYVPYKKPNLEEIFDYEEKENFEKEETKKVSFDDIDITTMSLYELSELAKKCKELNKINQYRKVCRIIKEHNKEEGIKEFHKKKEKELIKMKGRIGYD